MDKRYGLFGSLVYASHDGFYDGPWNFTTGLRWSINTMTMYFVFHNTYPPNCVVPFYAGYEKHEKFNLSLSLSLSSGWANDMHVEQPWNCGKYVTFHPSNETDYVKQCNGTISEEEQ